MAAWLHDTLHRRMPALPNDLDIYPGHQAGSACGVGLSGKPVSTLGFEKRFNPLLAWSCDAFVEALSADIPTPPQNLARIVEANLRGVAPEVEPA